MASAALTAEHLPAAAKITNGKLAMWIFLASEVMFFAGLIGSYLVLRVSDPVAFEPAFLDATFHSPLNVPLAAANTIVLIASSLTMALGVHSAVTRNNKKLIAMLVTTALLGLVFIVVKGVEYNAKFSHDVGPGTSIFYSCYFTMTGVHALHVLGGVLPLLAFAWLARDGRYTREGNASVEILGLYWHFVDVVWIFLFPLLYLLK